MNTADGAPAGVPALSDGRAGNARQALALAAALAPAPRELVLAPRTPWRWLAPRRLPGDRNAFGPDFAALMAAPPALAVGCGRQAALATRILRGHGARVVQVLDPRLPTRHWDLVVAPEHDGLHGDNVITLAGSLHPVDEAWLAQARAAFPALAALPSPRIAVLVGGPSAHADLGVAGFEALMAAAEAMAAREGGSLLVAASRRTPDAVRAALRGRPRQVPTLAWADAGDGANPYAGMLAWADRIACTADSVNMLSEACATAAPVFVHRPEALRGRPRRFVDDLLARGRIRPLDADARPFEATPLRETARVAAEVRRRLGLRTTGAAES
ncbi:mitochondrial fission ELM1 family protein [Luteimonas arsenica]|uniref:mitochondrial fission ELM1 family protein n=1 Tax=Luteimonas arsenica TaxID=1586242 RepID=UPI0010556900|nr:mitochondrial fission ELM1 family protein [Luteimonas arsenica]